MRCLGRTKALRRCRLGAKHLSCHRHRWQPYLFAFTIVSGIGVFAGVYQDLWRPIFAGPSSEHTAIVSIGERIDILNQEVERQAKHVASSYALPSASRGEAELHDIIKDQSAQISKLAQDVIRLGGHVDYYELNILGDGGSKIPVILEVKRAIPGIDLKQAKKMVESAPTVALKSFDKSSIEGAVSAIKQAGGEASIAEYRLSAVPVMKDAVLPKAYDDNPKPQTLESTVIAKLEEDLSTGIDPSEAVQRAIETSPASIEAVVQLALKHDRASEKYWLADVVGTACVLSPDDMALVAETAIALAPDKALEIKRVLDTLTQ